MEVCAHKRGQKPGENPEFLKLILALIPAGLAAGWHRN
jgi:hypothetical protein